MNKQDILNYHKVVKIINLMEQNRTKQLVHEEVAKELDLSVFHIQRLFIDWAGVEFETFLDFTSLKYAKQVLKIEPPTLFDFSSKTELSISENTCALLVEIEKMNTEEYKNKGQNLTINYSFKDTLFGRVLIASTHKGICYMGFSDNDDKAFLEIKKRYKNANYRLNIDTFQLNALKIFSEDWSKVNPIQLHLKGTDLQIQVWEALLKIPMGNLTTYGCIAKTIEKPKASRAVGTAIGNNPIAFLIPCHRVIQVTGAIGGYMWGATRKTALIGWEASKIYSGNLNRL